MGQCSTLPSEGRSANSNHTTSQRRSGGVGGGVDENNMSSTSSHRHHQYGKTGRKSSSSSFLQVHTNGGGGSAGKGVIGAEFSPRQQQKSGSVMSSDVDGPVPMDTDDPVATSPRRGDQHKQQLLYAQQQHQDNNMIVLPQPPEIAVRTRCYKLNLDSNMFPAPSVFLGPYADVPPPLTYSASSSDSEATITPLQVAIQTAKIFRGITVGKDGTILSQNARATRSNRGNSNKNKRGEKSRQATKIEKAKDLVEETILTGKAPESDEDANMQSLVIMGEYDDMKYLVRDGSKKLREATELPDDRLLNINRARESDMSTSSDVNKLPTSPRKRGSSGHHRSSSTSGTPKRQSGYGGSVSGGSSSQPPKLKSHPRDRPNARTKDSRRSSDHRHQEESSDQQRGENWGNALPVTFSRGFHSIWNCGATGDDSASGRATSPTQVVSSPRYDGKSSSSHHRHSHHSHHHSHHQAMTSNAVGGMNASSHQHHQQQSSSTKPVYEGRDSQQYGQPREGGVTTRAT